MKSNPSAPRSSASRQEVKVIAVGILLVLLVGIYFFGHSMWENNKREDANYQSLTGENQSEVAYPTITAESLQKLVSTPNEKFTIIDIRSREEYNLSHLPNALSYPNEDITTLKLPTNKIIIIGSDTDEELNNGIADYLGNQNVNFAFLKGGISAWTNLYQQVVTTGNPGSFVDQSKIRYISTDDVKKRFQAGEKIFVLDVQPTSGYTRKHLRDAVNIPVNELEGRIQELPSGQKIFIYGTNEAEAFQAGVLLFDLNIFGAEVILGDEVLTSGLFTEGQE